MGVVVLTLLCLIRCHHLVLKNKLQYPALYDFVQPVSVYEGEETF